MKETIAVGLIFLSAIIWILAIYAERKNSEVESAPWGVNRGRVELAQEYCKYKQVDSVQIIHPVSGSGDSRPEVIVEWKCRE